MGALAMVVLGAVVIYSTVALLKQSGTGSSRELMLLFSNAAVAWPTLVMTLLHYHLYMRQLQQFSGYLVLAYPEQYHFLDAACLRFQLTWKVGWLSITPGIATLLLVPWFVSILAVGSVLMPRS